MKKQFYDRQHKATILDYEYMLAQSDDECCFSLSEREVQLLLAIIEPIGWATRYQQEREDIDQATIEKWRNNLARKLMSGCCPDEGLLTRFTSEGVFQTSDDGGETWTDNPDADPRNDYVSAPPLPGSGTDTKCAAADNARDQFKSIRDTIISLLEGASAVLVIIAAIIGAIGFLAGISVAGIGISVLLFGISAGLLSMTPEEVETALDDAAMDAFRCILFCHVEDNGQFTYDDWLAVLAEIDSTFTGFTHEFFHGLVAAMGYIGLSNATTIGAATADDCDDCDCDDFCGGDAEVAPSPFTPGLHGTFISYADGVLTASADNAGSGLGYLIVGFPTLGECCYLNSVEFETGTLLASFHIDCGTPYAEPNWIVGTGENGCRQYLQIQTQVGSIVHFNFSQCP